VLPPETERVWQLIREEPLLRGSVLVGGTALAMRIGHRISEDLDLLFVETRLPRVRVEASVQHLKVRGEAVERNDDPRAYDEFLNAGMDLADYQQDYLIAGKTKLSFFVADASAKLLSPTPEGVRGPRVAELNEIFALKAIVTAHRSKTRDWIDLFILMRDHGFTLSDYREAFEKSGDARGLDIGLNRLCSGQPGAGDEGYQALFADPPSVEKLAAYFRAERSNLERSEAERAFSASAKREPD
jgi:Nucleotidyl transferase AbiEii toxin, Type IV TA system